jgi:hypothetical protein
MRTNKLKKKKYNTVRKTPKSNQEIVETEVLLSIYDCHFGIL